MCLRNGTDPALLYQLVYTGKDPLVLGVGLAAQRDVISFFRYEAADAFGTANPLAQEIGIHPPCGVAALPCRLNPDERERKGQG